MRTTWQTGKILNMRQDILMLGDKELASILYGPDRTVISIVNHDPVTLPAGTTPKDAQMEAYSSVRYYFRSVLNALENHY